MPPVEFLVPGRPVSVQGRNQARKKEWEEFVRVRARLSLPLSFSMLTTSAMLVIYYFHTDPALDIDNFVKPLQDALKGVIVEDDSLVSDLIIRKRDLRRSFVIERVTPTLAEGLETQDDFLYVSVNETRPEEVPI